MICMMLHFTNNIESVFINKDVIKNPWIKLKQDLKIVENFNSGSNVVSVWVKVQTSVLVIKVWP